MGKNILVLNGASRKNGNTVKLIQALSEGAASAGYHVQEFYLDDMNIRSCKGCLGANSNSKSPCSQKDDMDKIYAELESWGYSKFARESVLLMTADGADYSQAVTWYRTYERNLGWTNGGEILGKGKEKEAYQLGVSL